MLEGELRALGGGLRSALKIKVVKVVAKAFKLKPRLSN
jgi:hypothetical protein